MQYFFYGTLIDPQTLARVLGRRPRRIGRLPAVAAARRVVALTGTPYPTLIKDDNGTAQGIVVNGLGARDAARLLAYEGRRYRLTRLVVQGPAGIARLARTFVAASPAGAARQAWPQACRITRGMPHHKATTAEVSALAKRR